jgi:hypothetical protein
MDRVAKLCAALRAALVELEPGTYDPERAATLAEQLATTEKACGAAKARMATRAASCGAHRRRGFADASDWLATATGTTAYEARRQLHAARDVEQCSETRDALLAGAVSLAQAAEVARTEAEVPGAEHELLTLAREGSLGAVRDLGRQRRVGAIDPEALYAKQRRAREFRSWRDELGMVCGAFALPPDVGVPLVNRIDAETDRLHREAKKAGRGEKRAAIAADALAVVCRPAPPGRARGSAGNSALNLVIDWPALARGHAHPGERSHVIGGGPIPARIARELAANAFVKAVLTDGVEVQRVKHFGRRMSAELRTALLLGPPPGFVGVTCAEAGCDRRYHLEWDHLVPVAGGGETSLANLEPKCWPHHRDKTDRDRASGWRGS